MSLSPICFVRLLNMIDQSNFCKLVSNTCIMLSVIFVWVHFDSNIHIFMCDQVDQELHVKSIGIMWGYNIPLPTSTLVILANLQINLVYSCQASCSNRSTHSWHIKACTLLYGERSMMPYMCKRIKQLDSWRCPEGSLTCTV